MSAEKFLFVTDLDNTLVGDDRSMDVLNEHLHQHRQAYGTKIVYSTGRSLTSYQQLKTQKNLLEPDVLITAVGTEIYHANTNTPDTAWSNVLSQDWDREQVVATAAHFSDLVNQPEPEQRPYKVSYFLTEEVAPQLLPRLESILLERGLSVKLIYSGGKDLDILPQNGGKGEAMQFLRRHLEMEADKTVVCGDSGNDIALFEGGKERGIIVGNAMPELRQWYEANPSQNLYLAQATCAGGIFEGLKYFGFL